MVAILHPTGPGSQIPIDRAVVLIGRSPECDVVLDVSSKISRMHCALVQVDADYYIRDLGSMNGVTVAGQRVEKDEKLVNGIEVMIGDVKFLFLENVAPAVRQPRTANVKGTPVFVDETIEVLDAEVVEVVEPTLQQRRPVNGTASSSIRPSRMNSTGGRNTNVRSNKIADVEIVDVEIIEDVEVIDAVEIVDEIEIVEADVFEADIVEDVEIVEVVDVIEDVDVIDDVEVIDEPARPKRPRPPTR